MNAIINRKSLAAMLCVSACSLVLAPKAQASVIWRGDVSTGDFSQWDKLEQTQPGRLQIVTSPTRRGQYAYRAEVHFGDIVSHGTRSELVREHMEGEGVEK